ncbi:hypothetical protein E3T46_07825 [Cryobacterium sp. Hh11]|uniref:hypothetical protein n=1 Tax=Cryobacterium sp. Hh11 TaxID=2555868 RepID=UPI001069C94C|nr:hypothetical protein [Cryobacterium sp. Hh11]TFD51988.1 hypothetical protein E3T46_07825 [Cryobacterium sp. Hh11]
MIITFTPELGEQPITTTTTTIRKGVLNAPPIGTPIRATLGDTVIVGKIVDGPEGFELLNVRADAPKNSYDHTLDMCLWIGAGWVIELTESVSA